MSAAAQRPRAPLIAERAGTPAIDATATSSPASSQVGGMSSGGLSRADQIVYRFYLKTVGLLVDGRVTHFGAQRGERKKDRWFNLAIPDTEVHKADLRIYRAVSSYSPLPGSDGAPRASIPPLLIAFVLDTNDIPAGQTLLWNRGGARVALDPTLGRTAGPSGRRPGIVLERWTLRVTDASGALAGSEMAPPTAYRLGIIHFRALYAFIRLLPAYRLYRRLRRLHTGLRLGIKLWGPEGYTNGPEGITEAWDVMERDLVGIDMPLDRMVSGAEADPAASSMCERYDFPPLDLFGNTYELGVVYRPNVDFDVEDKESLLSERFVDMDEDWFTPTVARHRLEAERAASAGSSSRPATSTRTPPTVPASNASGGSSKGTPSGSTPTAPSSLGAGKWGALTEGLPFAVGVHQGGETPPSPTTGTGVPPYRRLSAHSLQPFRSISASPSTSVLRNFTPSNAAPGTPTSAHQAARAIPGGLPAAPSMARTSSFLSQSGRSLSHAQMANMYGGSASPGSGPFLGPGSSPPPLSFSKQALSAHRPVVPSPFAPSSIDRESPSPSPSSLPRRYSSQFRSRAASALGASPEAPSSLGRRTSVRESGLRHSLDEPRPNAPDNDEVHAFLRALDSWTPPPSVAPERSPRAVMSSIASASGTDISAASGSGSARAPLTRQHVEDTLKRMAGSFSVPGSETPSRLNSRRDSSSEEPAGIPIGGRASALRHEAASGLPSSGRSSPSSLSRLSPGSMPRSSPGAHNLHAHHLPLPMPRLGSGSSLPRPALGVTPEEPACVSGSGLARSLPGQGSEREQRTVPTPGSLASSPAPPRISALSPQTTGGSSKRGPVLVRGGFGAPASSKASTTSSSPGTSPVREYRYRSGLHAERERSERQGSIGSGMFRETTYRRASAGNGNGASRRTAPSSLGRDEEENAFRRLGVVSDGEDEMERERRARSRSPHSPVVEGLMARLALAHASERERGREGGEWEQDGTGE